MSTPSVSVIVPTHQRRELVQRAVASVLAQTDRDFELIVIDDGSTDGTEEALSPLGDRLVYQRQQNRGVAAARNAGVELARAPIVAFLDSDNRWLPSHLAVLRAALNRHPQAVLASSCPGFEFAGRWRRGRPRLVKPFPESLLHNIVGFISCVGVRRASLLEAGGFDEALSVAEDDELWLRLGLLGDFSMVRRRTVIREWSATSLVERGRVRGDYIHALEYGRRQLLAEFERSPRPDAAALARQTEGSLAFHSALVAIASGQEAAARAHLRRACTKLPDLSRAPNAVLGRMRITLPKSHQRRERLRYLIALAELWPDRRADTPVFIAGVGFWAATRAGDLVEAARFARHWLSGASPGYITRTMRARRHRARVKLDRRVHSNSRLKLRQDPVMIVQRVMLRTARGPLASLHRLAYGALARAAGLYLRGSDRRIAVYVRSGLGVRDPVYGVSDIDLALVLPGGAPADPNRVWRRWRRLRSALPLVSELMLEIRVEEEGDLRAVSAAPVLTHGLDGRARPVYRGGPAAAERQRLQERPGLYGPLHDWRLLAGPDYRPRPREWQPAERSIAAWLDLQFWWRQAFRACLDPPGPRKPYLCVKLVAEPARILLWLVHGERIAGRKEVLERALRRMPEEESSLRMALTTLERLPDVVEAPVEDALRSLVRQSSRVADVLARQTADAGVTPVRLLRTDGELPLPPGADAGLRSLHDGAEPRLLPLADWRARAVPSPFEPDESFALLPGDPGEPDTLGPAAVVGAAGPYPALRSDGLLVLAAREWIRGRLRAAQCAVTDPVSFALLDGREVADFPNAPGWSARDSAERAVAEHRGWLDRQPDESESTGEELGRLLAALRAAQLWASVEEGQPVLPLTLAEAGRLLAADDPGTRAVAEQACGEYEAYRLEERPPSAGTVAALRSGVLRLPAYGAGSRRAGA